ncbi:putative helicase [Hyaloraphidium curvatum]|nr:putative helicase [Hyaloraphidium curvatum]
MIGTQVESPNRAGTDGPPTKMRREAVAEEQDTLVDHLENPEPARAGASAAPKGDPTVETFQLPDELNVFKDESLPKLEVKAPTRKLTEDEDAAYRRKESLFRLIEKAGVFTNWVTENLEKARVEMLDHKQAMDAEGQQASAEASEKEEAAVAQPKKKGRRKKSAGGDDADQAPERRSLRDSTAASTAAAPAPPRKRKTPADDEGDEDAAPKKAKTTKKQPGPGMFEGPAKTVMFPEMPAPLQPRQPALVTGGLMRDYQLFGTEWMITLYENGFNGILADEMGLGKTIQTIAFIAHLRGMNVQGPILIVGPLSVLDNWIAEFARFAPLLKVMRYHGNPSERQDLRNTLARLPEHDQPVIVTSYEIAIRDRQAFSTYRFKYLIVDEGHRLKNMDSKLLRDLKSMNSENRLLLTGTPLQNNLAELWSLLNFCLPEVFSSLQEFQSWFDFESDLSNAGGEASIINKEEKDKVVTHLHTILRPFILRRVKSDVEASLPKKKEYLLFAPLVPYQRKLYQAALSGSQALRTALAKTSKAPGKDDASDTASTVDVEDDAASDSGASDDAVRRERPKRAAAMNLSATGRYDVDTGSEFAIGRAVAAAAEKKEAMKLAVKVAHKEMLARGGRGSLNNLLMQLRKICNHPYLFQGTEDEDETATMDDSGDESLAGNVRRVLQDGRGKKKEKLPDIVTKSGKMLLLERLLPALFAQGHKVLIFSQMVNVLYILEEWFQEYKGWQCSRLDGGVSLEDRKIAIDAFNNDPDVRIFLLSTRAGGLGINLVAADTVILYDSDWNPQADLQAQDRAHRIGQTKPVVVYRLVTEGTVEAKIIEKARSKRKLEKLVIQGGAMRALPGTKSLLTRANLSLDDLAQALYGTDAESVNLGKGEGEEVPAPESILTDEELEKLLDRSFGDADGKDSKSPVKKGKGRASKKSSPAKGAGTRFEEIAEGEWTNENADALADRSGVAPRAGASEE